MIYHLSYVACDGVDGQPCGMPGQPGDGAKEARAMAAREGFARVGSHDLCPEHRPDRPKHCGVPASWTPYGGYYYLCAVCHFPVSVTGVGS